MAILRSTSGKFYEIPDDQLSQYEVASDMVEQVAALAGEGGAPEGEAEEGGMELRARKMYENDSDEEEEEDEKENEPNPKLAQGNDLPRRFGEFPQELASIPICDIDPYYKDKRTFIVVSKSLSIYRFVLIQYFNCFNIQLILPWDLHVTFTFFPGSPPPTRSSYSHPSIPYEGRQFGCWCTRSSASLS